ncbi:hypothetical protein CBS101457_001864 [Exobasidium rhododendri]|nr:hypothetical protein CBS101457_001864 [Exobasidium rhododendri]
MSIQSATSTISTQVSSSSCLSSRSYSSASSFSTNDRSRLITTPHQITPTPSSSSTSQLRGRTNEKRSNSTEEHVCVVAFLVRSQGGTDGEETIERIQAVRQKFDQAYSRWEPHVTLIPPFLIPFAPSESNTGSSSSSTNSGRLNRDAAGSISEEDTSTSRSPLTETLDEISSIVQVVCSQQHFVSITFDEVDHFPLRHYSTFHLRPSDSVDSTQFLRFQKELELAVPRAQENLRFKRKQQRNAYKPHLTLGQAKNARVNRELSHLAAKILPTQAGSTSDPFKVKVDKIQLLVKPVNRSGPYDIYQEFNLP